MLLTSYLFSPGGYSRGKSILEGKYRQLSDVDNTNIQNIMNFPCFGNSNPYKINRFYKKLQANVNTLDRMGELRGIKGYQRFTLDIVGGMRDNLVRMEDNW